MERRCRIWHAGASERPLPACGERVGVRGLGVAPPAPHPLGGAALGLPGSPRPRLSPLCGERGFAPRSPHRRGSARCRRAYPPRPRACRGSRDRIARALDLRRAEIPCRLPAFRLRQPERRRRAARSHCRSSAAPATRTSTPSTRSTSSCSRATARPAWTRPSTRLMAGSGDDPDGLYGLARARGALVDRQAHLPLPAAARSALPRRIAANGAGRRLLDQHPEDQGPPDLSHGADARSSAAEAESDDVLQGPAVAETQPRPAPHRRRHAGLLGGLLEGPRLRGLDARAAARLRPLQGRPVRAGPLHRVRPRARLLGPRSAGEPRPEQLRQASATSISATGRSPSRPSSPAS